MSNEHEKNDAPLLEPPPSAEELAAARLLAESIDQLQAGAAVDDGDALVATAQMIHTSQHPPALRPARRDELIQQVLIQRRDRRSSSRLSTRAPWLALAASVIILAVSVVLSSVSSHRSGQPAGPVISQMRSRPSDDLLGRPIEDRAGASQRLDLVFADRLSGYRQIKLGTGAER